MCNTDKLFLLETNVGCKTIPVRLEQRKKCIIILYPLGGSTTVVVQDPSMLTCTITIRIDTKIK